MPTHAIDYATAPRRYDLPLTVRHMTMWLIVVSVAAIFTTCLVIPSFWTIFGDFKTDLPLLTKAVFIVAHCFRNDFGWIALLILPAAPIMIDRLNGNCWSIDGIPWRARMLFGLLMLIVVLALARTIYSMFLPMVSITGGVSSPKPVAP